VTKRLSSLICQPRDIAPRRQLDDYRRIDKINAGQHVMERLLEELA
jgi:hypothetical protein